MKHVRTTQDLVRLMAVTILVSLITILVGCSGLLNFDDSNDDNQDPEASEREVSIHAQEILDGLLQDIVGPVLQLHGYDVETVTARSGAERSWNAVFDSYPPPGEEFVATGTIEIDVLSSNPVEIQAHTPSPITFTGGAVESVGLTSVTARWASGTTFEGNEPEEVTGTFSIDGTDHAAADVIAAMDEDGTSEEIEIAGGVMSVVQTVLQFYYIGPDHGMTVNTSGTGTSWRGDISFDDFAPSGGTETANGNLQARVTNLSPFTVRATTPDEVVLRDSSGTTRISLDATVTWAAGAHPMSSSPETITGTITINGESHNIAEMGRLPSVFLTAAGTYEQSMKDRAWRPVTDNPAEPWSWVNYMRFDISPDGRVHVHRHHTGQYPPDGEIKFTGPLFWDEPATGLPTLWFGSDGDDQIEFLVRDHTASRLFLEPKHGWGDAGAVEFLFTAGQDNLSGLLVNREVVRREGEWDEYRTPITQKSVELYIVDLDHNRSEFIAATTTDTTGAFVWNELSELSADIYNADLSVVVDGVLAEVLRYDGFDVRHAWSRSSFRLTAGASKHYFVGLTPGDMRLEDVIVGEPIEE
ncbi:MAG: hypothetical protein ACOCYB_08925 [Alkalispirochaeta sp.]